jgi:nicotinate-nucleotide adenylyltransferase
MRLWLVYGGTFDPVHNGHLAIARSARDVLGVDVRMMPAADPPHRAPPGATAVHRARMLDLAVAGESGLKVDRRELERDGRSYTAHTLRALRRELGQDRPAALLVGTDSFLGLPEWKEWRSLFDLAHFVVAERSGSSIDRDLPAALAAELEGRWATAPRALDAAPAGRVLRLHQPLHEESASAIRDRIAAGGDWQARVPAAVAGYIQRHRLYGVGEQVQS